MQYSGFTFGHIGKSPRDFLDNHVDAYNLIFTSKRPQVLYYTA